MLFRSILFINAVNEVTRERAQSFLTDDHVERIVKAYQSFDNEPGFTRAVSVDEIRAKDGNLSIPLYISVPTQAGSSGEPKNSAQELSRVMEAWLQSSIEVHKALDTILKQPSGRS